MEMPGFGSRYYIPALGRLYARLDPLMLPMLRIAFGALLIPHGCQKLFGWFGGAGMTKMAGVFENLGYRPGLFWVTVVALTEVVGGLMLIAGAFTRLAALAVAIFMVNAIWVTSARGFFWTAGGWEFPAILLAIALVFAVKGGGLYSVDSRLRKEL